MKWGRTGAHALLVCVVCVGLATGHGRASAGDAPTPAERARAVVEAVRASGGEALSALAAQREPDPWLVADEIEALGDPEAMKRFAGSSAEDVRSALVAYAASRASAPRREKDRETLAKAEDAIGQGDVSRALSSLAAMNAGIDGVLAARRAFVEGVARQRNEFPLAAMEAFDRAAEVGSSLHWTRMEDRALYSAGRAAWEALAYASALRRFESLRTLHESIGDRRRAAIAMLEMASVAGVTADYPAALRLFADAGTRFRELDDPAEWDAVSGQGEVQSLVGDTSAALESLARARARFPATPRGRASEAQCRLRIGNVLWQRGENDLAFAEYEQVLRLFQGLETADPARARGYVSGQARAKENLALCRQRQIRFDEAAVLFGEAGALFERAKDARGAVEHLENTADFDTDRGEHARALAGHEAALTRATKAGLALLAASARAGIARTRREMGRYDAAVEAYEAALGECERLQAFATLLSVRRGLAITEGLRGRHQEAVAHVLEAAHDEAVAPRGERPSPSSKAGEERARAFDAGVQGAHRLGDLAALEQILESERALRLIEALGGRDRIRAATAPPEIAAAEAAAVAAESDALARYRESLREGRIERVHAAREAYRAARQATEAARIASEAAERRRGLAGLLQPRRTSLAELQRDLEDGQSFVYFATDVGHPLALVVERASARAVDLGDPAKIRASIEGLLAPDKEGDARTAIEALRDVLSVGLAPQTKTVLVCPDGVLAYVPLSMVWPDKSVCFVPSASVYHALLADRRRRGTGRLAIGDPDTAGHAPRLNPLPESREEARAFADSPEHLLLGTAATEGALRRVLEAKQAARDVRWDRILFACHGLVDAERPAFSALVLAAEAPDDGFLTTLDVLRLRMPADLVLLSACETAKGDGAHAGEGLPGLVRAFTFAGTPRVVASLWKVDDAAAHALMTEFHALWKPKDGAKPMGTAAALRAAQVRVRAQERWAHPHHWAPWVLWGLPD